MSRRPSQPAKRRGGIATLAVFVLLGAGPAFARDSLGVFGNWAAFRDPDVPRCYAIATPQGRPDGAAWLSIGNWPQAGARGQVHVRLPVAAAPDAPVMLAIGDSRFRLIARGRDAWAASAGDDAAIIAAMRGGRAVGVAGMGAAATTGATRRRFAIGWSLRGAATAIDAAALGCADRD